MLPIERLDGLGVRPGPHGPRLRVWSANAQRMRLCLLAADGGVETELEMHRTPEAPELWELVTPLLAPGARYALRADGPQGPGHAFDPAALLLDPYAKGLERIGAPGEERWCGVVGPDRPATPGPSPRRPLAETVVYELHVRGFTRRAGFLPPELRGSYAGLGHPGTVEHLLRLGVTAVELLPVHAFASERFLRERGMANFWGYNTLGFFAPHPDYASPAARAAGAAGVAEEFRQAVGRLHEAGIEVLLDVVYNHTAEGGADGP
ncbi:MAG: glycogen debranching enzyme GlgX, partial [Pseudoclavibacter sp.]|nr:glycogen debranching enzyme GlgX [Pseudoclavibacter sp.]